MLLIIDNYDSFTLNLVDYFEQLGQATKVIQNNVPLEEIKKTRFNAIVLSPGPGTPEKSGLLLEVIREYHNRIPMLGICLGHQALGKYFGGTVERSICPMHGKLSTISIVQDPIFDGLQKSIEVVRYHSLIVNNLPNQILQISFNSNKEVMAFKHKKLPVYGLQFHPESILTKDGIKILENWLRLNHLIN